MKQLSQVYWLRLPGYLNCFESTLDRVTAELPIRKKPNSLSLSIRQSYRSIHPTRLALIIGLMLTGINHIQAQTCTTIDYLYLNDPTEGATHKFRLGTTISATEIAPGGNPWLPPGTGGVSWSPHGLGQDLNGNLYIGQHEVGPIAKFKPDGTLVNLAFINDGGFNFVSKDGYVYVNTSSTTDKNNRISRYSLCDGSLQGYVTLNGASSGEYVYLNGNLTDWGLEITSDGTFYANAGFSVPIGTSRHTYIYTFKPTEADWTTNHPDISGHDFGTGSLASGMSTDIAVWGIASDNDGNMYMVVEDSNSFNDGYYTWVLKYDKNYNLVSSINTKVTSQSVGGYQGARGIIYYASWDRLLLAGGKDGDCIAIIDPKSLTYTGALVGNVPGQYPKTLRVASEACPVGASLNVDTTMCNVSVGDKIFLQNIVGKCNAPISGGTWTADAGNSGIVFQECDLSFTVTNIALGCGKFVLHNVGGTCGDFTITVNVDFANVTAPVIAGDQVACDTEKPAPFTITQAATGSNAIHYQWQKSTTSCTDGFTDIAGATASTYAPDIITQTTYYRVVTTVAGGCTTPHGSCTDISNCVTVGTKKCCPTPNCYQTTVSKK